MVRSSLSLLILVLPLAGGCPFVFGPPDLSKVDALTADDSGGEPTSPTVDETGGDTGTPPTFDVPTVVDFDLKRFPDRIGFAFSVVDADQDYVNGTVVLSSNVAGAVPLAFTIPGDLDVWDALGRSVVSIPQDWLPCDGLQETWEITLTDAAGHVGPTVSADLDITGLGMIAEDLVTDIGWLQDATVACVEFDYDPELPNAIQEQLQLDREDFRFTAVDGGDYTFELAWQNVMDVDLMLFGESQPSIMLAPPTVQVGPTWESFEYRLEADAVYVLQSRYYFIENNAGPYLATLLMGPVVE